MSLFIAASAYVGVPLWAMSALQHDTLAQAAIAADGAACGMGALAIVLVSFMLSAALSLVASAFGFAAYRKLPAPRSKLRLLELSVVVFPFAAGTGLVASFFLAFG